MTNLLKVFLSVACLLTFVSVSHAQEKYLDTGYDQPIEHGVKKHTTIPHNLEAIDQNERPVNFDKMAGENGIVLYFVRSADWCPYCAEQLVDLSRRGSMLEDEGYNIVVVSHDSRKRLARFTRKYDFPYPMISDSASEIITAFDLFNNSYLPGTAYYGISHPAMYIIGKDGFIIEKYFNEDFKKLLFVDEVKVMLNTIGDYDDAKQQLSKNLNP